MKITKKELFKFCDENNDAINELQSQSDSTDFLLAVLIQQLKDSGVIDEISPEPKPQLKTLDQSVFDGLDEKWQFAAMDLDSEIRAFEGKPFLAMNGTMWDSNLGEEISLGKGARIVDWYESLIERDKAELTGSDLAKEVLKTRCAVARVSDISDFDAADLGSDNASTAVLKQCDSGLFYTTNGARRWFYAVLINNQGEPLTAKEVGL